MRWLRIATAFAVVAALYFHRLDRPLLWDDEADTGVLSRNALHSGVPTASDGRNVTFYDGGSQLNRQLLSRQIPWVQYYLGAASLAVFGDDTAGLRTLFALVGLLAFFPLLSVLSGRVKCPEIVAALVLLAPQTLLFQRNARYYPILILLHACLVWHLSKEFRSGRVRTGTAALIFVFLFHTHPFAAACTTVSVLIFCGFFRRNLLPSYVAASLLGFISWFVWYQLQGPAMQPAAFGNGVPFSNFGLWLKTFLRDMAATLGDMDAVGSLPVLLLAAFIAILLVRNRRRLAELCREPLFGFVLVSIAVQVVATAVTFGTEAAPDFGFIRYMPHLTAFALVACLVAADAVVTAALPFLVLCVFAVAFNFGTLSHWMNPFGRDVPVSWAGPVYAEVLRPGGEAWDEVPAVLRHETPSDERDHVVVALPEWTQAQAVFYLGGDYIVPPDSAVSSPKGWALAGPDAGLRLALGDEAYGRLNRRPEWLVDSIHLFSKAPAGYVVAAVIPSFRASAHDGTRPELTRHAFVQEKAVGDVTVYRLGR